MHAQRLVPLLVAAITLTLSGAASADELSPTGKRVFFNASLCFKELVRNDGYFDGEKLGNQQHSQLVRYHRRVVGNVECVRFKMKRLPVQDRSHPDYKRYLDRASEFAAYADAMNKALRERATHAKAADDQCRAFQKVARPFGHHMRYWFDIDKGRGHFGDEKRTAAHVASLDKVAGICGQPEFKGVGERGCHWLKLGEGKSDPAAWCSLASRKKELAVKSMTNYAAFRLQHVTGVSADDVERRDGWIPIEDAVSLAELPKRGDTQFNQVFGSMRGVAKALGMPRFFDRPELREPFIARMRALVKKIEEKAPSYALPKKQGSSYGTRLAKKGIRAWHRKARVMTSFQTQAGWKVHKNGLDIPTSRTTKGHILFRLPGATLCQLRSWTLTETYRGSGRFQRAKGVRIGYVRWQRCK